MKTLILASLSEGRKKLLKEACFEFKVMVSHFDEDSIKENNPTELARKLALAKARMVAQNVKEPSIIVAGDQIVMMLGQVHGKPESAEQVRQWLTALQGSAVQCIDGYAVIDTQTGQEITGTDVATVYFNSIPASEIEEWIRTGEPFKKAGGFSIKEVPSCYWIKKIEGEQSTITGLPMHKVVPIIKQLLLKGQIKQISKM